jgi:8-amino-7-oxononanoate synthase
MDVAMSESIQKLISRLLVRRRDEGRLRSRRIVEPIDSTHARVDGKVVTLFASNDYLGLTHHPKIIEAVAAGVKMQGFGAGAAGLITGYSQFHELAERAIAEWKQMQSAVLLPSGYQANVAAVQTLAAIGQAADGGARFLLDKLAHASLLDAVRAGDAPFRVFPHNHLGKLERLLSEADPEQLQIVVTESIFSMDGDPADLHGLASLKRKYPFVLLLDEAHATGVYGEAGNGLAAELGLRDLVDISVITLSKAMGGAGGAVCASNAFSEAIINFGRAYIYSTSIPASTAMAVIAAIDVMRNEPNRQKDLRASARWLRDELVTLGFQIPPGDSPIIPIIFGSEVLAMQASEQLLDKGILIPAVRPPTVPRGTSRLRITLSWGHTESELKGLVSHLRAYC